MDIIVASFTDAWIETLKSTLKVRRSESHLLQMRGLKHRWYAGSGFRGRSHLLQMRGLKLVCDHTVKEINASHLLQMRGLKHRLRKCPVFGKLSHLLQMRGLKPWLQRGPEVTVRRIFYRCVD